MENATRQNPLHLGAPGNSPRLVESAHFSIEGGA
jgi:hypothetical protein